MDATINVIPMTPSAAMSDFDGRRYGQFVSFNFLLSLAAPQLHGVLVLVTGNKFIARDNDTGVHWCHRHRR
jgi:hypothetical protein